MSKLRFNPDGELKVFIKGIEKDSVKDRTVLITGGAGFIGSHVAEFYARKGYDVTVLDNLSREKTALYNWNHLKKNYNIKLVRGDVIDRKKVEELIEEIVKDSTLDDFVKGLINDEIKRRIVAEIRKIYPIRHFEIRKTEVKRSLGGGKSPAEG